jgi:hypothetical protein
MPIAQLDQFVHAPEMKAVPPLVLATIAAGLLGLFFRWLEHGLIRLVRSARGGGYARKVATDANVVASAGVTLPCPICNSQMVKRKSRRGARAGQEFWGCFAFPKCRGTRSI